MTEGRGTVGDTRRVHFFPVTEGPPTVVNWPVVMKWEASVGAGKLTGAFERNRSGDTRSEIHAAPGSSPVAATLWSAQEHLRRFLDYRKRSVRTFGTPHRALTSGWTFGTLDAIWSDEYQTLAGQNARKIVLMETYERAVAEEAGSCWVAEALGLVLREEVRIAGQATTWQVTELEQKEPSQDVLRIPPDFTEAKVEG
jgi:hypothetical protein